MPLDLEGNTSGTNEKVVSWPPILDFTSGMYLDISTLIADGCKAPVVEIYVSPLVERNTLRLLEIGWDVQNRWKAGDWVGLYNHEPLFNSSPIFK